MIAFQLLVMKVLDNGLTAYTPRPGYKQFCRTIASSIKYVCALLAYLQPPSAICIHSIPSFDFLHQISAESNDVPMQKISSVNGYDKRIFFFFKLSFFNLQGKCPRTVWNLEDNSRPSWPRRGRPAAAGSRSNRPARSHLHPQQTCVREFTFNPLLYICRLLTYTQL